MHNNCAYYAGIMLNALPTYYAPNYVGIISAGLTSTHVTTDMWHFKVTS